MNKEDLNTGQMLLLDKEVDWTSFDVVNKLRSNLPVKKVGHAGTLDPLATGLLIICTGGMTKQIDNFQGLIKEYTGIITLGAITPSYDLETEISKTYNIDAIEEEDILKTAQAFIGWHEQVAPAYSAVKQGGKKNYERARKGEVVPDKKRWVQILEFEITKIEMPDVHFKIVCSKGTYIRSIAFDFGRHLQNGGYLKQLRRTKIGEYAVEDAKQVHQLLADIKEQLNAST